MKTKRITSRQFLYYLEDYMQDLGVENNTSNTLEAMNDLFDIHECSEVDLLLVAEEYDKYYDTECYSALVAN